MLEIENLSVSYGSIHAVRKLSLQAQGITILLMEQNATKALSVADRGYVLENGEISFHDTAENLRSQDRIKKAYLGH
ncbi:hypothetical protein [Brevibacillus nitrificans]|uniref:hypothetical protein n=1 Tax=Brevibacillus nitrificans TaxID=651560 RepID=UPI00285800FA|nr:hypothetical protein [Brevibacillus nitrificans]MDR7317323.1 ABC-type branched-subunit amino acid transport system ATPase component [Brevibacillus nitrificans]